eukprot:c11137_g1_i1.p1 GENE.c11137_g1_i1~~c11137_g1_i1.p1  ORF type:complete len:368 (-),score=65.60 c11137_g1_i1:45-1148(-)
MGSFPSVKAESTPRDPSLVLHVKNSTLKECVGTYDALGRECLEAVDSQGRSALHWAAMLARIDVLEWLQTLGIGLSGRSSGLRPREAIHFASMFGQTVAVEWLVEHGVNINAADEFGWTPLTYTAIFGFPETCASLLRQGASLALADDQGRTPLHWACEKGHEYVARLLLTQATQSNQLETLQTKDTSGSFPIHIAARLGHLPLVQLLVSSHSSWLSLEDSVGRTPFQVATAAMASMADPSENPSLDATVNYLTLNACHPPEDTTGSKALLKEGYLSVVAQGVFSSKRERCRFVLFRYELGWWDKDGYHSFELAAYEPRAGASPTELSVLPFEESKQALVVVASNQEERDAWCFVLRDLCFESREYS